VEVIENDEGTWSILVETKVMTRIQQLPIAQESLFVDSTGHVDVSHCSFTAMMTATKVGALPLSLLLHGRQTASTAHERYISVT
jgi:hypothetical protein